MELHFNGPAFDFLVQQSYDPEMGARPVRRAIQRLVSNPLSKLVLSGALTLDDEVKVGFSNTRNELTFRKA